MASAASLRTLLRPAMASRIQPVMLAVAPFSTTRAVAAAPAPSIKSRRDLPKKVKRNYKKKAVAAPVKKPNPGERKAFRKRIQLSNNSALPIEGLEQLQANTMSQKESLGKIFGLPNATVDQLRAIEAFKTTQAWNLFRSPHVLVREETAQLIKMMDESVKNKKAASVVLTGSRLSGKSLTLLQAMSHALLNEWVVVSVPEGQDLTNGNTEYSVVPGSEPLQYSQPVYIYKLLQNILKANKNVLAKAKVEKKESLIGNLQEGATLADLIAHAREGDAAWPALKALWTELTLPGRPPVLLCLDGLSHISMLSDYRSPNFEPVHAHDLTLVGLFVDALSGKTKLPNGGAVLAATSGNNNHKHPSQELVLAQLEAGQAGKKDEIPTPDPYERQYDERVYESLKNSYVLRIEGMSMKETTTLMEYWGASGLVRNALTSQYVAEKWALAGHGNVGELERATLMTMRM